MKKSKFKVKVTNFTTNNDGTVMHDKMKKYIKYNSNMKKQIEIDRNNHKNKFKLNDNNEEAVDYVLNKRIDNSLKINKKVIKESQIIESESSGNEDTTPIMQLLKKSPDKRVQSDDSTPISQLVKESKLTSKKKLFTETKKRKHKEVIDTIEDDTTPISVLITESKKNEKYIVTSIESSIKKMKVDKTVVMSGITDLMNLSKKVKKKKNQQA